MLACRLAAALSPLLAGIAAGALVVSPNPPVIFHKRHRHKPKSALLALRNSAAARKQEPPPSSDKIFEVEDGTPVNPDYHPERGYGAVEWSPQQQQVDPHEADGVQYVEGEVGQRLHRRAAVLEHKLHQEVLVIL